MPLKPQASSPRPLGRTKQLFFLPVYPPREYACAPYYYLEARIDYADVRTGHHMTCELNDIVEINCLESDLLWTRDMVCAIDPGRLQSEKPEGARIGELPLSINEQAFAELEIQYVRFLLRHAAARLLRNYALNIYSASGETGEEFQGRCMELLNESFRKELDVLREVANRRLERIEAKFLKSSRPGEFESDRIVTQGKSRFHAASETIAHLFLKTELTLDDVGAIQLPVSGARRSDLEDALETLTADARRDVQRLLAAYQERVRNIDEYIVHPNLKDIHLVRSCVVWMPEKAMPS